MTAGKTFIYGKHAIIEAITSVPKAVQQVFVERDRNDAELEAALQKSKVKVALINPGEVPRGADREATHQGVFAHVIPEKIVVPYESFIEKLDVTDHTSLVILGELQDPHNVGAVIRSAAAFGASAVLIPEHNQAPITGTVVKVSAGMVFRMPIVSIGNVNTTVRDLKEKGFWIYGLSEEAKNPVDKEIFNRPSVFILGNEGKGIREKTLEHCDITLSIPMHPRCESLNVSVSAAVVLYAWSEQHKAALQ